MDYKGKKAAFYTLGCKLNFSETSTIAGSFKEVGFDRVEFDEKADVYVINTCSVTNQGDKASRNIVRKAVKQNPDAMVIDIKSYHKAFSWGDRTRSFLKVQDGCDYYCSFCTIP